MPQDQSALEDPRETSPVTRALRGFLPHFRATDPFRRFDAFGFGIGPKEVGGADSGAVALRVYVRQKMARDRLPPERRVPLHITIETEAGAFEAPTDVIEMVPPRPAADHDPKSVLRPVPGGASISVPNSGGNGTLGGWVFDQTDETIVFLSNRHVLGGQVGATVIQPGANDDGDPADHRIGLVKRVINFKPYPQSNPTPAACNYVDAGIGMPDSTLLASLNTIEIGPAVYEIAQPKWLQRVQKFGKNSGLTTGRIVDTDFMWRHDMPLGGPGNPTVDAGFCDLLLIVRDNDIPLPGWSTQGDSGSIVFTVPSSPNEPAAAVGLHFASDADVDGNGVACKIQNVFAALHLGVLCDHGFSALFESIAAGEEEHPPHVRAGATLRARMRERVTSGLSRDVERRLTESASGKGAVDLLRRHRHRALLALLHRSDLRRAAIEALRPVLQRARTSDDILEYKLDKADVARIARVLSILRREGHDDIARALLDMPIAKKGAAGKSVADLFEISL
jgi:hypothetical protein